MGDSGNPLMMVLLKDRPIGSAMVVYRETGLTIGGEADTPPAVRVTPRADGGYDLQTGTSCAGPWSPNERISLGAKQLEQDPFGQFMAAPPRGTQATGPGKGLATKGAGIKRA